MNYPSTTAMLTLGVLRITDRLQMIPAENRMVAHVGDDHCDIGDEIDELFARGWVEVVQVPVEGAAGADGGGVEERVRVTASGDWWWSRWEKEREREERRAGRVARRPAMRKPQRGGRRAR